MPAMLNSRQVSSSILLASGARSLPSGRTRRSAPASQMSYNNDKGTSDGIAIFAQVLSALFQSHPCSNSTFVPATPSTSLLRVSLSSMPNPCDQVAPFHMPTASSYSTWTAEAPCLPLVTDSFHNHRSSRTLVICVRRQRSDATRKSRCVGAAKNWVTHASIVRRGV